jgi:hypothetical protein
MQPTHIKKVIITLAYLFIPVLKNIKNIQHNKKHGIRIDKTTPKIFIFIYTPKLGLFLTHQSSSPVSS